MVFRDNFWFLSNMYPCSIQYKGHTYTCVEAAFQAQKDAECANKFESLDGFAAKKLGRNVKLRPDWELVKKKIMKDILKAKFTDPELKAKLKAVSGEIVEDNSWNDTYWGRCNGKGENNLGKLLMEVRDML